MEFTRVASWLWFAITAGGFVVLAVAYAFVLLQRRRSRGPVTISADARPTSGMLAGDRAPHVLDILMILIGIWIGISVWVLGTDWPDYGAALAASNIVFGLVIALFALAAVYRLHSIEELASAVFAIWVGISPWIIGTATILPSIAWSNVAAAVAVIILSLLGLLRLLAPSGQLARGHHR